MRDNERHKAPPLTRATESDSALKTQLKNKISDYTEQEFLAFLHEIERANENEPEKVLSPLLMHFNKITEHPSGINLIYRPATEEDGELEQILSIVKAWRLANGKDSFKTP